MSVFVVEETFENKVKELLEKENIKYDKYQDLDEAYSTKHVGDYITYNYPQYGNNKDIIDSAVDSILDDTDIFQNLRDSIEEQVDDVIMEAEESKYVIDIDL